MKKNQAFSPNIAGALSVHIEPITFIFNKYYKKNLRCDCKHQFLLKSTRMLFILHIPRSDCSYQHQLTHPIVCLFLVDWLPCLLLFAVKYLEKSKVMVFSNGVRRTKTEKWFLGGIKIEMVNSYKYLGFELTPRLSLHSHFTQKLVWIHYGTISWKILKYHSKQK